MYQKLFRGTFRFAVASTAMAIAAPASLAQLEVQPPSIEFGERGQNERPEATITLKNSGQRPLLVREIKKSCDCLTITPSQLAAPIPVGGIIPIRVSMGSGRAMGRLDKWITIVTQDPRKPEVRVPVTMRVLDEFSMEPREVRLEGVIGGEPQRAEIDVTLRQGRPLSPVNLAIKGIQGRFNRRSQDFLRATVAPIAGGQRITLELDPRHPEGPISAEIEASLNGKSLFIPVNGDMFAWIKVSPNYINFSRAQESDPPSTIREVVLTAADGKPFKVLAVSSRPARSGEKSVRLEFTTAPLPAAPHGAGSGPGAPEKGAARPPAAPAPTGEEKAPGDGPASAVQKVLCRAFRGDGEEPTFFGTVTIRTDHPQKPEISLKYSGFFAPASKK